MLWPQPWPGAPSTSASRVGWAFCEMPGQRVVLAHDADDRRALAELGDERRRQSRHAARDAEAFLFGVVGEDLRRLRLLERRLGEPPDLIGQIDQRRALRVHLLHRALLERDVGAACLRDTRSRGQRARGLR